MTGRRRPGRRQDDTGASLLLTMAFVVGVGLVVGGLLTYSQANIAAATATLSHAQTVDDAAGALQTGINALRTSDYVNADGQCFSNPSGAVRYYPGWTATAPASPSYAVTCAAGPGTGVASGLTYQSASTRPGSAILTLGTDPGEPGIGLVSNRTLTVKGRVVSNGSITRGGSSSALSSPWAVVKATGSCSTSYVISVPTAQCGYTPTAADASAFADPTQYAIAPPTSAELAATLRTVPATCPASTATLQPGYYDDAAALTALSACGKTIIFSPGTYWFDFHNADGGPVPPAGSDVWTVNKKDTYLIGGTPDGWSSGPPPSFPGACVNPLNDQSAQGVRFVFGGDSRMVVTAGNLELCGTYSRTSPPIVLSGATSGADTAYSAVPVVATSSATPTGTAFTTASGTVTQAVATVDGTLATAGIVRPTGTGTATGSLSLGGFVPSPAIPAGSVLTSAKLVVTHREQTTLSGDALSVKVTPSRSGASTLTPALALQSGLTTDTLDLTSGLAAEAHTYGLAGVQVRYDVTAVKKSGSTTSLTAALDAVRLVLSWKPPAVRGERTALSGVANCVGTAPYVPATSNCALLTTSGNFTSVYLQGTVYAPQAALDVVLTNASTQVFRSGLVVRSLRIGVTPATGYTGPVIEIPDDSPGPTPVDVYFTAYQCPAGSSCPGPPPAAPWRVVGRAAASYADTGRPSRRVTVKAWQIPR